MTDRLCVCEPPAECKKTCKHNGLPSPYDNGHPAMNAVTGLIGLIEEGEFPIGRAADAFEERWGKTPIDLHWGLAHDAFLGKLDGAAALMEVALPDYDATISFGAATVALHKQVGTRYVARVDAAEARSETPARAWLLAILKEFEGRA